MPRPGVPMPDQRHPPIRGSGGGPGAALLLRRGNDPDGGYEAFGRGPLRIDEEWMATGCMGHLAVRGDPQRGPSPVAAFFSGAKNGGGAERTRRSGPAGSTLDRVTSLDDAHQYRDDGEQQKNVDEPAQRVVRDHSKQPHQDQ